MRRLLALAAALLSACSSAAADVPLDPVEEVNRRVNASTTYVEDPTGRDYWDGVRYGKGDCEDYALTKRSLLIASGWPAADLRVMTVALPPLIGKWWRGHAVLHIVSRDLILDMAGRPQLRADYVQASGAVLMCAADDLTTREVRPFWKRCKGPVKHP